MFAEDRHARHKGCQKPERVVQADSLGQEPNGGWQRVFGKGTKGAQQATPKPAAMNPSLVDSFARDRYKPSVMKIPALGCVERDATYGCPLMTLGPALEKVETISSDVPDSRTTWSRTASAAT